MSTLTILGTIGFTLIIIAIIVEILGLFDVSITSYGSYVSFIFFMVSCILILPNDIVEP